MRLQTVATPTMQTMRTEILAWPAEFKPVFFGSTHSVHISMTLSQLKLRLRLYEFLHSGCGLDDDTVLGFALCCVSLSMTPLVQ